MVTKKTKPTKAELTRERNRVRYVAQRAVDGYGLLYVHGFLTDTEKDKVVKRICKYLTKNKLILVDKGFKDYLVLFDDAAIAPKWQHVYGIRST